MTLKSFILRCYPTLNQRRSITRVGLNQEISTLTRGLFDYSLVSIIIRHHSQYRLPCIPWYNEPKPYLGIFMPFYKQPKKADSCQFLKWINFDTGRRSSSLISNNATGRPWGYHSPCSVTKAILHKFPFRPLDAASDFEKNRDKLDAMQITDTNIPYWNYYFSKNNTN